MGINPGYYLSLIIRSPFYIFRKRSLRCPVCRHEIPILEEYHNDLKDDGLNVSAIDIHESEKKVKSFVEKQQINYPVALDSSAKVAMLYKVVDIPLNVILAKGGVIRYKENRLPSKEVLDILLRN